MKKKYKINLLAALFTSLICIPVIGQNSPHEFSVYGGTGLGILKAKASSIINDKDTRVGGVFGVGYTYYFNSQFGLQTGLEYSLYTNKFDILTLEGSYEAKDNDLTNETVDFQYKTNGYKETLKSGYLQIPVMAQYQKSFNDNAFYLSAGMKIGFAVTKSFDNKLSNLSTKGYYSTTGVVVAEDSPDLGFGEYSNLSSDGSLKLKTAFIGSIETGMKWSLAQNMFLYTGVYFDYGFNDVNKGDKRHLIEYNQKSPDKPILNSATMSIQSDSKQLVEKMNLMALGVKVKLAFSL